MPPDTTSGSGTGGSRIQDLIARLQRSSPYFNSLNAVTMRIYFQTSPGWPDESDDDDVRGIQGLQYRLRQGTYVIQEGTTGDDGKIEVLVRPGTLHLDIMHGDRVESTYEVRNLSGAAPDEDTIEGVKRRLRTLGYQLGNGGTTRDGVDGTMNEDLDRALLEFQVDAEETINGEADADLCETIDDEVDNEPGS
ncbi:MAG: hypothetical protein JW860_16520 [Sedimentisphaerales bacterium]|nr:hypothetical protein [Sedimentisphaerales bacterium]